MTQRLFHIAVCATALFGALGLFASPARADRCDDLAKQLAGQIDGLKIGATRGGIIYLQHPAAARASLGCSSRNAQGDFYAISLQKKPSADFISFVASATAQIFTIPRDDAERGVKRCIGRLGFIRGYDKQTRYRKLDIHCARTNNATNVTVSREKE
jgi:hypothetical protein